MFALLLLPLMASCVKDAAQVTLDSLLDEMISVEESARYPLVPYRCLQVSSYDRSSVSPDSSGWFANNDGYGIVRMDTYDISLCFCVKEIVCQCVRRRTE